MSEMREKLPSGQYRDSYNAYQRAYYRRRILDDPEWRERRREQTRAYRLRRKLGKKSP